MQERIKIALKVDYPGKSDRYYAFRLKQYLSNEPQEYSEPNKLMILSDIEGDFQAFCRLLLRAGVVDKYLNWTFKNNHLVVLGDCFDRGSEVMECLWLIYSLEEKALRQDGYVHFILGNHEIMNMNGDWRYVHPKYAESFQGLNSPIVAIYDGNEELWRWLRTKNIIEKIGDFLFVHAGISPALLSLNLSVCEINEKARPYYASASKVFDDPILKIIFNSEQSPFWYRGFYNEKLSDDLIDAALHHFSVTSIITGHTIVDSVSKFYNGKVINVNTDHANGNSQGLLIRKKRFYRIFANGRRERIM